MWKDDETLEPEEDSPSCDWLIDIAAYLAGNSDPAERVLFEAHLADCELCRAEMVDLRSTLDRLHQPLERVPQRDLAPWVLRQVATHRAAARRATRERMVNAAIGLLVCLLAAWGWVGWIGPRVAERETVRVRSLHRRAHERGTDAVTLGSSIERLVAAQEPSGLFGPVRWGGEARHTVGFTGLAVLALLNAEDVKPASSATSRAVDRAADRLLALQLQDGWFGPTHPLVIYNHAIATVALLETLSPRPSVRTRDLEGDTRRRAAVERALGVLARHQGTDGGWGYFQPSEPSPSNTAASAWPLQALLLGRALGFDGLDGSIESALGFFVAATDPTGHVGYTASRHAIVDPPSGESLAPAGAFLLLLAREEKTVPAATRRRVLDRLLRSQNRDRVAPDLYRDFFERSALAAFGRSSVPRRTLAAGSDPWEPSGGDLYTATLTSLVLGAEARQARISALHRTRR